MFTNDLNVCLKGSSSLYTDQAQKSLWSHTDAWNKTLSYFKGKGGKWDIALETEMCIQEVCVFGGVLSGTEAMYSWELGSFRLTWETAASVCATVMHTYTVHALTLTDRVNTQPPPSNPAVC